MKRSYVKLEVCHLGGRIRQKEGFLLIFGTLAKPLLVSAVGAIGGEVLEGIGKKIVGGKNAVEKEEQKDIDMPRNNILLRRLPNERRVVNRHALAPTQVRIARMYVRKIGPRRKRMRRFGPRKTQVWTITL